jgi:hypothetical protein
MFALFFFVEGSVLEHLVILSRSWFWLALYQTVFIAVVICPAVSGATRNLNRRLNPSAEALVLFAQIVTATLCSELFAKPVKQPAHLFLAEPLHLLPRGHYGGFEFFLVQFSDFSIRLGWLGFFTLIPTGPNRLWRLLG